MGSKWACALRRGGGLPPQERVYHPSDLESAADEVGAGTPLCLLNAATGSVHAKQSVSTHHTEATRLTHRRSQHRRVRSWSDDTDSITCNKRHSEPICIRSAKPEQTSHTNVRRSNHQPAEPRARAHGRAYGHPSGARSLPSRSATLDTHSSDVYLEALAITHSSPPVAHASSGAKPSTAAEPRRAPPLAASVCAATPWPP